MALQDNALTTRDRLVQFAELGTLTAAQQTVLDSIINAVSDYVENYCQRTFKLTTYTNEVYDGRGSATLTLKNFPITTFTRLQERVAANDWDTISSDLYVVDLNQAIVHIDSVDTWRSTRGGQHFVDGPQNYRVTYNAGYNFDNTADTPVTLESVGLGDLEYAVWKLCTTAWESRKGGSNVSSERLGDYSVTFTKMTFENDDIRSILDKYVKESWV